MKGNLQLFSGINQTSGQTQFTMQYYFGLVFLRHCCFYWGFNSSTALEKNLNYFDVMLVQIFWAHQECVLMFHIICVVGEGIFEVGVCLHR